MSSSSNAPTRHVVLDDTDSSISYNGPGWVLATGDAEQDFGNFGPVYNNTLHQVSDTPGASLLFQFNGTRVQILGSLDNDGGKPIPSWQCFIDGILFGKTTPNGIRENSITLCDSSNVPDGTHEVNVTVTTSGPIFYFDYVWYDPSPSAPLTNAVVKVDNNDPDLSFIGNGWNVRYANLWPLTGSGGDQMIFPFYGKSVTFLGISPGELNGNQSSGTYAIDSATPTKFVIPGHGSQTEYNQLIFRTPDVEPGPHTLVVTYQGNANQAPLVLDWLYVANGSQPAPSLSMSSSSSAGPTNSPPPTGSPQPTPKSTPTGAIVGGVVGGVVVILALLALLFWRRRRRDRPDGIFDPPDDIVEVPRPYTDFSASLVPNPSSWAPSQSEGSDEPFGPHRPQFSSPPTPPTMPLLSDSQYSQSSLPLSSKQRTAVTSTMSSPSDGSVMETSQVEPRMVMHEDSGLRVPQGAVIDVPPSYTPS